MKKQKGIYSSNLLKTSILVMFLIGGVWILNNRASMSVFAETSEDRNASSSSSENEESTTTQNKTEIKQSSTDVGMIPQKGYVGPKVDPTGDTWTEEVTAEAATAFVTNPYDKKGKVYFGRSNYKFSPGSYTSDRTQGGSNDQGGAKNGWLFEYAQKEPSSRPLLYHGLILDGKGEISLLDRSYTPGISSTMDRTNGSIENALMQKNPTVEDYHLYRNPDKTGFKATMYDNKYRLSYTFIEKYDKWGGINRYFIITNSDTVNHSIGAFEMGDVFVDNDSVSVQSLGPNKGFYMDSGQHKLKMNLVDKDGKDLGGWDSYTAGVIADVENVRNYRLFYKNGNYTMNSTADLKAEGESIFTRITGGNQTSDNSGYLMRTNPKDIAPGDSLVSGSYLTYYIKGEDPAEKVAPVATLNYKQKSVYTTDMKVVVAGKIIDTDTQKAENPSGKFEIVYNGKDKASEKYNLNGVTTEKPFEFELDSTKLKLGENKITITAVDATGMAQETPMELTIDVFELKANPISQVIKLKGLVVTDVNKLISNVSVINKPKAHKYKLEINSAKPSGKPVDNTKVGFYYQDMLLTDTEVDAKVTPSFPIAIPVSVTDDDTVVGDTSAIYAHDFTTTVDEIKNLKEAELTALIIKKSEAKGWHLTDGSESKVTLTSTTLKVDSTGSDKPYTAKLKNAEGKEIEIEITMKPLFTPAKIISAPDEAKFGDTNGIILPFSSEDFNLDRQKNTDFKITVLNPSKQSWTMTAKVTKKLSEGTKELTGVLKYIKADGTIDDLEAGTTVGSNSTSVAGSDPNTQVLQWDEKQGVVANLSGTNKSLASGNYSGVITWTLVNGPVTP